MKLADKYPHLIVYDGDCGLCARSVQFVLRHDKAGSFRFCPIQSPLGVALCAETGIDPKAPSSLIAVVASELFTRSRAVLRVGIHFGGAWELLRAFLIVPPALLDLPYDWVARRRRSLFPKTSECLTDPDLKKRIVLEP